MDDLTERFTRDRDSRSFDALATAYRPLVASVCQRFLRHHNDVDDAIQETFLKLAIHAPRLHGSIVAWLTSTAATTCIDLIRQSKSQSRRLTELAQMGVPEQIVHHAIWAKLHDAMEALDWRDRELIAERIFRKVPLRVISEREKTNPGTITRRVSAAIRRLAVVLHEMGVTAETLDERSLANHIGWAPELLGRTEADAPAREEDLRFAPDWRGAALTPGGPMHSVTQAAYLPGWNRPLRVGVFVSQHSTTVIGGDGIPHDVEFQVRFSRLLLDPAFQLISIVEPGTSVLGPIERTIREYELIGGLISADDEAQLRTLDVIIFGINYAIHPAVARALCAAVRSGVGLLNDWWTGAEQGSDDVNVRALALADSQTYTFHTRPKCGMGVTGTVIDEHALFPGLKKGMRLPLIGCGMVFVPAPGTKILATKDLVISPEVHGLAGLGPAKMIATAIGQLGQGRVLLIPLHHENVVINPLTIDSIEFFRRTLLWLAEPRRQRM